LIVAWPMPPERYRRAIDRFAFDRAFKALALVHCRG